MEQLQIFNSERFGEIRTIIVEEEPWFVATDICNALEIANVTQAVQRLDDDERSMFNIGRQGEANCVNEYGLYNLVLASRKKEAKDFKRWITHEVIPSIRRTGGYEMSKPMSAMQLMELQFQAIKEVKADVDSVNKDLQDFKQDMPLLAVECEKITRAVKAKGTELLGGKNANAYRDKSIRDTLYRDIHNEVRRQFGVNTYKAIKRSQCDKALEIISGYILPMVIAEKISDANAQISFGG